MLDYKVKIGLVPVRRDTTPRKGIFNWGKAEERGRKNVKYIRENFENENVSFIDLEGIIESGLLFSENDVEKVYEKFTKEKVDAILFINSNFGPEETVALLAKKMGKPVLIWAPIDDAIEEDGTRWTDSQCGLFAVSRQLQRRNVPFSYIETCAVDEKPFLDGFKNFISVACMVKNFKDMRVGQMGLRPKPFCSVMFNDAELLQKFGIQVIPVNNVVMRKKFDEVMAEDSAELNDGAKLILSRYIAEDDMDMEKAKKVYALVLVYKWMFSEYNLDVICAECWSALMADLGGIGVFPCIAYSILADMGYIISCESDMNGVLTMALLSCASLGKNPPFFGEFTVRGLKDRNSELIWHCGPFAYSLKKEGCEAHCLDQKQWFNVKDGHYTVSRIDQLNGKYTLFIGEFDTTDGPYTTGTYLWAKLDDFAKWERKLIEGPYIHHMAEIEGGYAEALKEFCKFMPEVEADPV
ncbi:MAG: hypothetical protein U0M42_08095 [Acutalibacteraceae bacterium]|nr:hypothetical protein [Acutalibacteraceae bacterium]